MNILFVVNAFPPSRGGVELHVQALANALRSNGHTVYVETLWDKLNVDKIPQNSPQISRNRTLGRIGGIVGLPFPFLGLHLFRKYKESSIDVVSTHTRFFFMSFVGTNLAAKLNCIHVHTEHGSNFVKVKPTFLSYFAWLYDVTLGRFVLRTADLVLAISEESNKFVKKLSGRDAKIFHNAVDLQLFEMQDHVKNPMPSIVFLGRLVHGKGWDTFLQVVSLVLKNSPTKINVEIIGDGPCLVDAIGFAQQLGIKDQVTFSGYLDRNVISQKLKGAIYLNFSVLSEGFQTTLIESLASGGRVITFPVPGAEELRASNFAVSIVSPTETVKSISTKVLAELAKGSARPSRDELLPWGWEQRTLEFESYISECISTKSLVDRG